MVVVVAFVSFEMPNILSCAHIMRHRFRLLFHFTFFSFVRSILLFSRVITHTNSKTSKSNSRTRKYCINIICTKQYKTYVTIRQSICFCVWLHLYVQLVCFPSSAHYSFICYSIHSVCNGIDLFIYLLFIAFDATKDRTVFENKIIVIFVCNSHNDIDWMHARWQKPFAT